MVMLRILEHKIKKHHIDIVVGSSFGACREEKYGSIENKYVGGLEVSGKRCNFANKLFVIYKFVKL